MEAITCYLDACRQQNEIRSQRYLAKALWLLTYDTEQLELAEAVDKYRTGVPPVQGLPWIPQRLTCLVRSEGKLILNLLSQGGWMFPQAGHGPIRTPYLTLKNEASRMHEQISTLEVLINRYEEEEKAKSLLKLKAEKRLSWRSLQTGDVRREAAGKIKAGKSPQIGDVHLEAAGKTKAD